MEENKYEVICEPSGLYWYEMSQHWTKTKFIHLTREVNSWVKSLHDFCRPVMDMEKVRVSINIIGYDGSYDMVHIISICKHLTCWLKIHTKGTFLDHFIYQKPALISPTSHAGYRKGIRPYTKYIVGYELYLDENTTFDDQEQWPAMAARYVILLFASSDELGSKQGNDLWPTFKWPLSYRLFYECKISRPHLTFFKKTSNVPCGCDNKRTKRSDTFQL